MAPKLDETVRAWESALGVKVTGEVRAPGMLIKQLKIGDAILELLGPDSPESPMASRPPGLASMCAWEVPNLDATIALAREGGSPRAPSDRRLPRPPPPCPAVKLGVGMQLSGACTDPQKRMRP